MSDTKQLPKGLPPLPEGTYYAGTLADFEGAVDCWVCAGALDKWTRQEMIGMRDKPSCISAKWHVALPIKAGKEKA